MNPTTPDSSFNFRLAGLAVVLGLLAGCAGHGVRSISNGQTADEVTRAMGPPTGRYALSNGGQRLEYASGPFGKQTYMIDLDASGRVTGWDQVLTEINFNSLPPGMTRDQVMLRIGHPSERFYIGWQKRDVWAYRYPINECLWFMVSIGSEGRVVDMGYGIDHHCDAGGQERN